MSSSQCMQRVTVSAICDDPMARSNGRKAQIWIPKHRMTFERPHPTILGSWPVPPYRCRLDAGTTGHALRLPQYFLRAM